jgi:hypothetical protein
VVVLYYSGSCGSSKGAGLVSEPEDVLRERAAIMLSYYLITNREQEQDKRMPRLVEGRMGNGEKEPAVGYVESHFLDSGAFTLKTAAKKYAREHNRGPWDYYDTDEFWAFVDGYAAFVRKYRIAIDLYANVDAIPNPELTYRNQKYLENKHGLRPVPVVHYKTDMKWLRRYMDEGYELVGLGGLVGNTREAAAWLDRAFGVVCDAPDRLPKIKVHGFGVTNYDLMIRYPWWSVDSTSWTRVGAFGGILVPPKRGGKFVFDRPPMVVKMSSDSPAGKEAGRHYLTYTKGEQQVIRDWLAEIGVPVGRLGPKGEKLEKGVVTNHSERRAACLLFFERMREWLDGNGYKYPWPFRKVQEGAFAGLFA